jgi:uncharacterized protein involved in cysteine biosynthesis
MITAFARAIGQLPDPAFRRPLLWSVGLAIVVFVAIWIAVWFALTRTSLFETVWLDGVVDALGGLATIVLTFLLFPGVAGAILALFLDGVVGAVERRHYPDLAAPRQTGLGEQLAIAIKFIATVVALNLLALPLYLIPAVNLVVFYGLNGYLLGREYFELVTPRRMDTGAARVLWRGNRARFVTAGAVFALTATIPLLNLLAPVVAAATMTHLVESARRTGAAGT